MQMTKHYLSALFVATTALIAATIISSLLAAPAEAVTIDDLRPEDPENVRVVKRGPFAATVKWDEQELATHYELRIYRAGGKDKAIIEDIEGTSYRIKKSTGWLKPNRKYYVRVAAVNEDLGSGIADAPKKYFRTKPDKPTNISITSKKNKKVTMRWHKPGDNKIRFYYVQVREYKDGKLTRKWREKVKNGADVVEHTVDDLKKDRKYKIRIKAGFNNKNLGHYSDWTVIKPR